MVTRIKTKKIELIKQEKFVPYYEMNGDIVKLSDIKDYIDTDMFEIEYFYEPGKSLYINFNIEQFPFCCGVYEIGELDINPVHTLHIKAVIDILDAIIERGKTYLINTNGKGDSVIYEQALAKCKYWTKVKEFKNADSGNLIKMWISNNE